MGNGLRIGVDLGGTKIEGILLEPGGGEKFRERVSTPRGDYDGTVRAIREVVARIERQAGATATVGVGIPGTIIPSSGLVKNANSTWLNGKPFQMDLTAAMDREVRCANDANCFAMSEAADGAGNGYGVVFGVIIGTGCGGGVVVDGKIVGGANGVGGEWGHNPLPWMRPEEYPGPECYCGKRGCVEKWISGTGFADDYQRVTGKKCTAEQIVTASAQGDREAEAAAQRLEDRMARSLAVMIHIIDPDVIVLGGGLSQFQRLYQNVQPKLKDYVFGGGAETPVVQAVHGDSSGVRGAAWLWSLREATE